MRVEPLYKVNDPYRTNRVSEIVHGASSFVLANMLWVICSLPLITFPAATAGLFAVFVPWVRGESPEPLSEFFVGMRKYWRKSTLIMLLNAAFASLTILNLLLLNQMELGQILAVFSIAATMVAAMLVLLINAYIWTLLVLFDLPLSSLLQNAIKLGVAHLGWTVMVLVMAAAPLVLSLFLPKAVLLTLTFSASALILNWGAWRVIRRYIREDETGNFGVRSNGSA